MAQTNAAYDLSIYETAPERRVERRETKEAKLIKARSRFALGRKIISGFGIALLISLVIRTIATNATITSYSAKIATTRSEITKLESEIDYLEFTLESRMSLDEIEEYAVNTLGMVKMDSTRKRYVQLESENSIVSESSSVKEKFDEAVQPFLTNLMP